MLRKFIITIFILVFGNHIHAAPKPSVPQIDAKSFFMMDYDSGEILAETFADEKLAPASITKIMTAYVVANELAEDTINLKDMVTVSEKAWRMKGSRMFIEVGKQVPVEDILKGIIIQSGNDASIAIAEHIAGSEAGFANLMNHHAEKLGMTNSHFMNSTGWPDDDHYTTARDMAYLTADLIRRFPEIYALFSVKEMTFNNITQKNRNKLLWRDESVDGVKTGYTEAAGYCLVASAKRQNMRLISVVMNTKSTKVRERANAALLNFGFRFYETHTLYKAGEELSSLKIWKGEQQQVSFGLAEDLVVTIPRGRYKKLDAKLNLEKRLMAPIDAGEKKGTLVLTLEGETLQERPLVALHSVKEGGLVQRLTDEVRLMFE